MWRPSRRLAAKAWSSAPPDDRKSDRRRLGWSRLGHQLVGTGSGAARETAARCANVGQSAAVDRVDVTDHERIPRASQQSRSADRSPSCSGAPGVFDWALADEADPQVWSRLCNVSLVAAAALTPSVLPPLVAAAPSAFDLPRIGRRAPRLPTQRRLPCQQTWTGRTRSRKLPRRSRPRCPSQSRLAGMVAAGSGLWPPAGQAGPDELLQPEDVAAAVRFVVTYPARGAPPRSSFSRSARPNW